MSYLSVRVKLRGPNDSLQDRPSSYENLSLEIKKTLVDNTKSIGFKSSPAAEVETKDVELGCRSPSQYLVFIFWRWSREAGKDTISGLLRNLRALHSDFEVQRSSSELQKRTMTLEPSEEQMFAFDQ